MRPAQRVREFVGAVVGDGRQEPGEVVVLDVVDGEVRVGVGLLRGPAEDGGHGRADVLVGGRILAVAEDHVARVVGEEPEGRGGLLERRGLLVQLRDDEGEPVQDEEADRRAADRDGSPRDRLPAQRLPGRRRRHRDDRCGEEGDPRPAALDRRLTRAAEVTHRGVEGRGAPQDGGGEKRRVDRVAGGVLATERRDRVDDRRDEVDEQRRGHETCARAPHVDGERGTSPDDDRDEARHGERERGEHRDPFEVVAPEPRVEEDGRHQRRRGTDDRGVHERAAVATGTRGTTRPATASGYRRRSSPSAGDGNVGSRPTSASTARTPHASANDAAAAVQSSQARRSAGR